VVKRNLVILTTPLSPLAMAALDMMDDDDDDDDALAAYWQRYDDAKWLRENSTVAPIARVTAWDGTAETAGMSEEERDQRIRTLLREFHDGIGVDPEAELVHRSAIVTALAAAQEAAAIDLPMQAVRYLEEVLPHLQPNSQLGATALLELARAYICEERNERAHEIYTQLASHPQSEIRRQAKQGLSNAGKGKRGLGRNTWWSALWDMDVKW
jgi:hypothetical protein